MLMYGLRFIGCKSYDDDFLKFEISMIIVDSESVIPMAKCNKDPAGSKHVARRYCNVRQGPELKEHVFDWIGGKRPIGEYFDKILQCYYANFVADSNI